MKKGFTTKKLSTQLGIIMCVMLTLVFSLFIGVAVKLAGEALTAANASNFNNISEKSSARVQSAFDSATSLAKDLQYYMSAMYDLSVSQKKYGTADPVNKLSSVSNKEVTALSKEVEDYLTYSIRSAVANNPDIMGAGVFFEPYAFDDNIEHYALYVGVKDVNQYVPFTYDVYSAADYYSVAIKTQKPYYTEPYDDQGAKMISASYPIVTGGVTKGVVVADINVSNFNQYAIDTSEYPTAFNEILTDQSTVVFDSTGLSGEYVGMNTSDFIKDPASVAKINSGYESKKAFSIQTEGDTGEKLNRYYYPLTAGEQTWWSLVAVNTSDMNKVTIQTSIILIIMAVVALAVILSITIFTLRKRINPINKVVDAAKSIANGKLDIDVDVKSNNEIGMLADTFSDMSGTLQTIITDVNNVLSEMAVGNFTVSSSCEDRYVGEYQNILLAIHKINTRLSDTLKQISEASDQVSSGSEQVSSGAQALSQGATEQASSVEELAATINDISMQVNQNAENAKKASQQSTQSSDEIFESNKKMQHMIAAIGDISSKSSEIGKIIKTIEDIAFQTNILALNAAVEAARAGSAGKGFAVVADEVRNLASKSAEAAKNTTALIEETVRAVENGTAIADDTASSMLAVVDSSKLVTSLVDEISNASAGQASAINQVTLGIDQISSVIQTNSATAEESAAASEELSGQASVLNDLVSRFKLKEEAGGRTVGISEYMASAGDGERTRTAVNHQSDKY